MYGDDERCVKVFKSKKELVDFEPWQKLRKELIGKWKKEPEECVRKLREFLGPIRKTSNRRLAIVYNYLTGSGFRMRIISHPEIDKLLDEIRQEVWRRRKTGEWC